MKFLAMHITNQKLSFDIFTVGNVQNIFMEHDLNILMIFVIKEKWIILTHTIGYCYKYTCVKTGFVLQGHRCTFSVYANWNAAYVTVDKCLFTHLSHFIPPFDGLEREDRRSSSDGAIFTLICEINNQREELQHHASHRALIILWNPYVICQYLWLLMVTLWSAAQSVHILLLIKHLFIIIIIILLRSSGLLLGF